MSQRVILPATQISHLKLRILRLRREVVDDPHESAVLSVIDDLAEIVECLVHGEAK